MKINSIYLFKNLFFNPFETINEIKEDLNKDSLSKQYVGINKKLWICGLPKSGTTLIEQILDFLPYVRIDRSVFRSFPDKGKITFENFEKYLKFFPENKFSYVKTHLEHNSNFLDNLKKNNFNVIVSLRDIRDTMISRYYHILNEPSHWQHEVVKNKEFEKGFIDSLTRKTDKYPKNLKFREPLSDYYFWIKNWISVKDNNIIKVWFENYKKNPEDYINKILKYTRIDFNSKDILEGIKKKNEIDKKISLDKKLKRKNKNISTFRVGKSEQWKKLFNKKIETEFYKILPGEINNIISKNNF